MHRIAAGLVLVCVGLTTAQNARGELKSAGRAKSFRQTVHERLCHAGRFRFETAKQDNEIFLGRFVEHWPSGAGHPNAKMGTEPVQVVRLGNESFRPEVGKTYCLLLTDGSKRGMTIEAFGPDDEATAKELKEVIESPSAFENDPMWRKRRALWTKFRKDAGSGAVVLLYAEDDALQNILYAKGGEPQYALHRYEARSGKSEPIIHAKVLPGMNRITFDQGYFRVWYNGSIEMNIGVGTGD